VHIPEGPSDAFDPPQPLDDAQIRGFERRDEMMMSRK